MMNDLIKFKDSFLREATSYIETISLSLIKLETKPANKKNLKDILYALHTLKSLTTTMNYHESATLCHSMENLFSEVNKKTIALQHCFTILFKCVDYLTQNINLIENNEPELLASSLIQQVDDLINHQNLSIDETMAAEIKFLPINKPSTLEVKVDRLNKLMNLTEELLINKMKLDALRDEIQHHEFSSTLDGLGRLVTDLQYHVMQARLTPIEFLFTRFMRMARDLAKRQGKELNIHFDSSDIELDRLLVDEIGESLAHLIRNAIDHGLETPVLRLAKNKDPVGNIHLRATRSRENIVIEVSDDGSGLNLPAIKEVAVTRKMITHEVNPAELQDMIFAGLSTTKFATEISGRGLGLSIVKQKVESIGGGIRVESSPNHGTTFFIEIPLTLAIIKTLFVKVANELYAIPIEFVERLLIVDAHEIKRLLDGEAILFEGVDIPVIRLSTLFNKQVAQSSKQPLLILHKGKAKICLTVDSLVSTEEIVIKPLNRSIKDNKYISGVTLVGSGHIVLILDVLPILQLGSRVDSVKNETSSAKEVV